jgi:hypothetical protein
MTNQTMNRWEVYLYNAEAEFDEYVNTVFYSKNCDEDYVLHSLINHDDFDPLITIRLIK